MIPCLILDPGLGNVLEANRVNDSSAIQKRCLIEEAWMKCCSTIPTTSTTRTFSIPVPKSWARNTSPARLPFRMLTRSKRSLSVKYRRVTRPRNKERSQAREPSKLSFHSLRHSAVTMLKASVSVYRAEIIGNGNSNALEGWES
jgi:hypothetical protein